MFVRLTVSMCPPWIFEVTIVVGVVDDDDADNNMSVVTTVVPAVVVCSGGDPVIPNPPDGISPL